ncbi:MAG: RNA methyltransferase [Lachnospiraceae bacterium]|nr:RNA methyltransferase [Lachnospiraceae bacterium]
MLRLIQVSGLEDPALDVFTKLSEVQLKRYYEPRGGLFIAESPKVVLRALDAGCEPVSLLVEDRHVRGEAAGVLARIGESAAEIPVYTGPCEVLTRLTGYALTRGVLCAMHRPPLRDARQLLVGTGGQIYDDEKQPRRIAVLENVVNPANVGAIFRNAAALGMDAVLLTDGCSDPLYRRTLRVSMGTALQIPWAWIGKDPWDWRENGMKLLHACGWRTVAMALRPDAVEIGDLDLRGTDKAAVILGAEGDGLLPETIAAADTVVRIPMQRGVDSLNVAAASAVAFYLLAD